PWTQRMGSRCGISRSGPAEWQSGARRHDHHGAARRDVGDRCDALLYGARWLVLVLRRDRSPPGRSGGLAHGEAGRSVGSARADSPRRASRLRPVRKRGRPRLGDSMGLGPPYIADAWINEVKWLGGMDPARV